MDMYQREFEKLNDYQKQAVTADDRAVLLNAAVGSGKTTVLVHKVLYLHLVKKVPLSNMFVLTFTRRAAAEIKARIGEFIADEEMQEKLKYLGTFHSVATQLLRDSVLLPELGYDSGFQILDNEEAAAILYDIIDKEKLDIKYRKKLMKRIEDFKNGRKLYGVMKKSDDIGELVQRYKEEKLRRNSMDFDDIIENCINVVREPVDPEWVIIDEFQDTDSRQLELVRRICGDRTSIFCIGDPNQIIYSWRSGTENIFGEFKSLFKPKELGLPLNYRSSKTIIEAANALLLGRYNVEGVKEYGNPIRIVRHNDEFNEACHIASAIKAYHEAQVPYRSCAVLYRRQAQLEILADVLARENIPYNIVYKKGAAFSDRHNEEGTADGQAEDGVNLLTLHASKGLEFSNVFIVGANMGNIPLTSSKADEPEEMRLFYVGITRAKDNVEISYVARPSGAGVVPYRSPYISMIPEKLLQIQDDEVQKKTSLNELMTILREQRSSKEQQTRKARHPKYGVGEILYEDEEIIKVRFGEYGEKEFSKMFSSLELI